MDNREEEKIEFDAARMSFGRPPDRRAEMVLNSGSKLKRRSLKAIRL